MRDDYVSILVEPSKGLRINSQAWPLDISVVPVSKLDWAEVLGLGGGAAFNQHSGTPSGSQAGINNCELKETV